MKIKKQKKFKYLISIIILVIVLGLLVVIKLGPFYNFYIFPPSANQYGKTAIEIMDKQGIYSDTKAWQREKESALSQIKSAKNYSDTYEILTKAIKVAGGKHSALIKVSSKSGEESSFELPKVSIKNDILYIKLPAFNMNKKEEAEKYAQKVLTFLKKYQSPKGVILDLRGNGGGDMGPMIGAVSPLLPDGKLLYFDIGGQKTPVTLDKGEVSGGGTPMKVESFKLSKNTPIAILTDNLTASSAEAVLIAFRGLENVKVFGEDTAGYASCNNIQYLYDGVILQLTIGKDVSRSGEEFCEEPISPDVDTKTPKVDAIDWICAMDSN